MHIYNKKQLFLVHFHQHAQSLDEMTQGHGKHANLPVVMQPVRKTIVFSNR